MKSFLLLINSLLLLFVTNCDKNVTRVDNLIGKSENEIIEIFGNPDYDTTFNLSDTLHEYRYGLLNIYSDSIKKEIEIKELIWKKNSNRKIVFWFEQKNKKWIAIDNLIWNPNRIKF